jgi:hypothetical protein
MADRKISELTSTTGLALDDDLDFLPISDGSTATTLKINRAEFFSSVDAMSVSGDITVAGVLGDSKHFLTRSDLITWVTANTPSVGTKISCYDPNVGILGFTYVGSGTWFSESGLDGWEPIDNSPDHYQTNTSPGNTDMTSALGLALAFGKTRLLSGSYRMFSDINLSDDVTFEPGASLFINSGVTVTLSAPIHASGDADIFTNNGTITGTITAGIDEVHARWFGVPQYDLGTNVASAFQDAVDLSQDLDCTLVLPKNGAFRLSSACTMKHGWNGTDSRAYNVRINMNGCQVVHGYNGTLWNIVPRCTLADKLTGRGDAVIEIYDGVFNGADVTTNNWTSAIAIQIGSVAGWCSGFGINKVQNILTRFYVAQPFYLVNARHLLWDRCVTRNESGGINIVASGDGAFVGDSHFVQCEFTGTGTKRPITITCSTTTGTAQARAIFFDRTVLYGEGSLLTAGQNGKLHEIWFDNCQFDQSTSTIPAVKLANTSTGTVWNITMTSCYGVNFQGLFLQAIGTTLGAIMDIKVDNGRFSLNTSAAALMQFDNVTALTLTNNAMWNNACNTCFDFVDGVVGAVVTGNHVPTMSDQPNYLVTAAGTDTNGVLVKGNIVDVVTGVVSDSMSGTDKDFTGNLSI